MSDHPLIPRHLRNLPQRVRAGAEGAAGRHEDNRPRGTLPVRGAGDYLEWSIAQADAAVAAKRPTEFVSKQVELTTALSEKLRARAQEFVTLATEAQASFTDVVSEATAKVTEMSKRKRLYAAHAVKQPLRR